MMMRMMKNGGDENEIERCRPTNDFFSDSTDNDSKTSTPPPPQSGIKLDQDDEEEDMVEMFNEETGEWNGPGSRTPRGGGDWESKGCWDF